MTKEEAIRNLDAMWKMLTSAYDDIADSYAVAYTMAVDALKAQDVHDTNVGDNGDTIYRQTMFDTAAEYEKQLCEILGDENELVEVVKILKHRLMALPSTQPGQKIGKIVRWMVISETPDHISYTPHRKCSLCGNELLIDNINYCYICGARLTEDREAEGRFE